MKMRVLQILMVLLALNAGLNLCFAAETAKIAPALAAKLASEDAKEVEVALETIRSLIASEPAQAAAFMREMWLKPLMDAGRYDTVADLTQAAICAYPMEANAVTMLQQARVTALLKAGRNAEALSNAKGLFNVVTMDGRTRRS